jgi:hypothetical protein
MKAVVMGLRPRPAGKESFHGKRVEFLCDLNGKLLLLTGKFVVPSEQTRRMEIHYTGRIDPRDLPLSEYVFRLSATHLSSVVPTKDASARAEYFMEKPLQCRLSLTKSLAQDESLVAFSTD